MASRVRLVQEIVDELGAEVMVNTPLPMGDRPYDGTGAGLAHSEGDVGEVFRRLELCGIPLVGWGSPSKVVDLLPRISPMVLLVDGEPAAHALGFNHPIAQLSTRTAIYWQDAHTRRGCFVLFLSEPDAVNKAAWLSQIYKAARYLSGEQSPWDEIGRGPCMGVKEVPSWWADRSSELVGCGNSVAWLDQWGLPWCQGHKVLPEKPKTKARRRERVRR